MVVQVDVSENYINRVRSKQSATITLNAYPDWRIPAAVIAVIPTADRSKATVKVRVGFKQRDSRIVPEMGARVSFLEDTAQPHVGVATAAVIVDLVRAAPSLTEYSTRMWARRMENNTMSKRMMATTVVTFKRRSIFYNALPILRLLLRRPVLRPRPWVCAAAARISAR